jgi:LPS-assembly lipoprotein
MLKILTGSVFILLITVLFNGCGFKLRGDYNLPSGIQQLQLSSTQKNAPLRRVLSRQLETFDINVLDNTVKDNEEQRIDAKLFLQSDQLERRLLSLFSTGQVAEYELVYNIKYQIQLPGEDTQFMEFDVTREYQDDPDAVLAKSRELDLIQHEMRNEAAARIIRQIASSYISWQQTQGG